MVAVLIICIFLFLVLFGLFLLLQALWDLREGTNRHSFLKRGMLGVVFIILSITIPWIGMLLAGPMGQTTTLPMRVQQQHAIVNGNQISNP